LFQLQGFCDRTNPNAIHLLEQNPDEIEWDLLSGNPNVIHLLEQNPDKINWCCLSSNPNAIHLLEQNPDKIDWYWLSTNPNAIHLLEQNPDKIDWGGLSANPSIFELDYNALKERCSIYKWELLEITLQPSRIEKYIEMGVEMGELGNYI
jgi:hypothetical protein